MSAPPLDVAGVLAQRLGLPVEQIAAVADSGDPHQLMMLAMLSQARRDPDDEPAGESPPDRPQPPPDRLVEHLIVQQQRALLAADRMALYVAEALGACPHCWGLDQRCPSCAGRGGPGSSPPDQDRLLTLVRPALRRLGLDITPLDTPDSRAYSAPRSERSDHAQTV
ncbi:hypothetical protein ACFPJ1_43070 [Kribbella qitaiheensis]|uniref:hypothetical protein n=1 Tax=Kribbella qitaiheensis TaxID=1544730 RepID=UPI00361D674B